MFQEIRRRLRDRILDFLNVARNRGHQPASGIPRKEVYRLLDEPGVEEVAKIPYHRVADEIDEVGGKELRDPFATVTTIMAMATSVQALWIQAGKKSWR